MVQPNVTAYFGFEILSGYEGMTNDYVALVNNPWGDRWQFNASTEISAIALAKEWLETWPPLR